MPEAKPAFILIPGLAPDPQPMQHLKIYLQDLGYDVYDTNFWGDGDRVDFHNLTIEDCQRGVRTLIQEVRQNHQFVIGIGVSLGAALLIEDAKHHADLDYIVSVGTPFKLRYRGLISVVFAVLPLAYPIWKRLQRIRPLRMFPLGASKMAVRYMEGEFLHNLGLVRAPILFLHSRHDPVTDYRAVEKFFPQFVSSKKEMVLVENINHVMEYYSEIIIRSLFKFLQPGHAEKTAFPSLNEAQSAEPEEELISIE